MTFTNPFRNADGLIDGIVYERHLDGSIHWRKMIPPQYLYPKETRDREQIEVRFGKKFEALSAEEVAKIDEKQLLVTLAGINYLAWLRGVKSSVPQPPTVTQNEVTAVWAVEFIPNCEDPYGLTGAGLASASLYSVSGRFQLHLAAIAGNRAYVRAVRQALRIEILGKDEFDPVASAEYEKSLKEGKSPLTESPKEAAVETAVSTKTPQDRLAERCAQLGFTLEDAKLSARKIRKDMIEKPDSIKECKINEDPDGWTDFKVIKSLDCYTLLTKLDAAAAKKAGKAR